MQDGRDLPRDERLQRPAHGRQRLGCCAGRGRRIALEALRLDLARAVVRAGLHAPHARVRHPPRAGGDGQGRAQRARLEQPEGALQEARHGRGRAGEPLDRQAAASARLLRRDRQWRCDRRHQRRAGARPAPAARADPRGRRPRLQAAPRHALPGRPDRRGRRALRQGHPLAQRRRRPRRDRPHGLLRRLHLHLAFTVRGLWLLPGRRGRRLRQRRHDPARRQAPQQHQRRPSLRGLHPRHQHGDRERPPIAPRRRRFLPASAPTAGVPTPTTTARAAAARSGTPSLPPTSAGARPGPARRWSCGADEHRRPSHERAVAIPAAHRPDRRGGGGRAARRRTTRRWHRCRRSCAATAPR